MNQPTVHDNDQLDSLLGEVVEDYLQQLARGEQPQIERYAEDYPEIASLIRRTFPALQLVGQSVSEIGSAQGIDLSRSKQLGDFRLLDELGSGGMGYVYEAEQLSMGRHVALKVLPLAGALQPKALKRFRNEVRAAASLDHPNIVSVYSVGEERGVHYYAMQLIRGQTLADVIRELAQLQANNAPLTGNSISEVVTGDLAGGQQPPDVSQLQRSSVRSREERQEPAPSAPRLLHDGAVVQNQPRRASVRSDEERQEPGASAPRLIEEPGTSGEPAPATPSESQARIGTFGETDQGAEFFRSAARLGIQAAEALQHAHDQGVVHRDIKPGNLMLDGDAQLYIADFGLARIETDVGMTMTGDLVGTLRYMSPEQALGKRVVIDHRSDIYSLGMTLYELVTLRPAFAAENRQELLKQIAFEDPPKPRRINRSIPGDLETIVLKAIEKNPDQRYATAQELADDLRRFVDLLPIQARRPSLLNRASRWLERHRQAVPWLVAVVLLAITAAVAGLIAHSARLEEVNSRLRASEAQTARLLYVANVNLAYRAWQDKDMRQLDEMLRRVRQLSDATQPGIELAFLEQLARAHDRTLADYSTPVYSVAFSPDYQHFATAGQDGVVRIYEAETYLESQRLETGQGEVNTVAFSPDGSRIATAGDDGTVRIWSLGTLRELLQVQADAGHAFDADFTPAADLLATCGEDTAIRLWDPHTGEPRGVLEGHARAVEQIDISPDGRLLASAGSDHTVKLWDIQTRRLVHTLYGFLYKVSYVEFASDTRVVAVGLDKTVSTWDTRTGQRESSRRYVDPLQCVACWPGQALIAVGDRGGSIHVWDPENPSRGWSRRIHEDRVYSIRFSQDGNFLLTGSKDGRVKLTPSRHGAFSRRLEVADDCADTAFIPDGGKGGTRGRYTATAATAGGAAVVAGDRGVYLVDVDSGEVIQVLHHDTGAAWQCVDVSSDGTRALAGDRAGNLYEWDLRQPGRSTKRIQFGDERVENDPGPSRGLWGVEFSSDDRLVAAVIKGETDRVVVIDARTWHRQVVATATNGYRATFSPDGRYLAFTDLNDVVLWDLQRRQRQATLQGHTSTVRDIAFSPNSRLLATAAADRSVRVWDVSSGNQRFYFIGSSAQRSVAFAASGKTLVASTADELALWDVATGQKFFTAPVDGKALPGAWHIVLSKDDRRLVMSVRGGGGYWVLDLVDERDDGAGEQVPDGIATTARGKALFTGLAALGAAARSAQRVRVSAAGGVLMISGSNTVAVASVAVAGKQLYVERIDRWQPATGTQTLPAELWDISGNGVYLVGAGRDRLACRWGIDGSVTRIGDLDGGPEASVARGISYDGAVVVGNGHSAAGPEAFRWSESEGLIGLGDLEGGVFQSFANAVSRDGSVIVGDSVSTSGKEAYRWSKHSRMVGLGDLPGLVFVSGTLAVSADSRTIVGTAHPGLTFEAVRWTGDRIGRLGVLPGQPTGKACAVNADGSVIVGSCWRHGTPGSTGFVWDQKRGMRDVHMVLRRSGVDLTGWTLTEVQDVSDDGRTLVGLGIDPDGQAQTWIARLPEMTAAAR